MLILNDTCSIFITVITVASQLLHYNGRKRGVYYELLNIIIQSHTSKRALNKTFKGFKSFKCVLSFLVVAFNQLLSGGGVFI